LFDRIPDKAGMDNWMSSHLGGIQVSGIANSFVSSQEFITKFGQNVDAGT
jgi:uncharacterized membrane protein (DUF4010 family)